MPERDGLYEKYVIAKRDGTPLDPQACYFVLRLDTDPCARDAARKYLELIKDQAPQLARDLRQLIAELEKEAPDA